MIRKLTKVILQDVKSENETKKAAVILRMNAIIMCIYFLVLLCAFFITGGANLFVVCISLLCTYGVSFYTTYMNCTRKSIIFVHILTGGWIILFIRDFGWDCGVQHFIFVLLILNFTTSYSKFSWKLLVGAALCVFRLALNVYTMMYDPVFIMSKNMQITFQVINTLFVFISITTIMAVFTENSQEMEKKLVIYNEKLHGLAALDPLTGLLNRRSIREYLEQKEKECRDGKLQSLSLALADIDFFKRVNDTYGHECGDVVLQHLADLFEKCIGMKGKSSRWGGEEFLFVFDNINGDDAMIILDELRRKIQMMEINYRGESIKVTMTFGLGEFDFKKGIDVTICDIDEKLYHGKHSGRNKIVY